MRAQIVIATLVVITAAAGCGKSEEQKALEQAAEAQKQAAQQMAQGAQQMAQGAQAGAQTLAQGLQQMAQGLQQTGADGKPVPPVDFEKLIALLPDAAGWTRDKPRGQTMTMPFSTSNAEARYTKGESHVDLTITDFAFNKLAMAGVSFMMASGYSKRDSEGFERAMTLKGSPGFEKWTNDSKGGEVTVIVNNRFSVSGHGSGFDNIDGLRNFVSQVDLGKLAATK